MDSQTPTDAYFTNLLQGGSNLLGEFMMKSPNQIGQCSSQHGEVAGQESPLSPQIESTTKKSQRGGNFSIEEDNLLVSAWLNTSLDAIHGNEQKHKTYWNRVWEYFHKYKTFTSERNQNSLMNRWSTIQLGTNKFCGFFAQIESMHQSGVNEQDKIEKTEKKKTSATSSPFAPTAINLSEDDVSHDAYVDLERPLGRKAEKERLNKRKSKDSAGSNYAGILNGIMEDKKKANDKKMEILEKACLQEQEHNRINQELEQERIRIMKEEIQERFRIKQEKIRAEQLKEDERIIMMDTNGLTPMQQQYYLHRQMEILESQRSTKYIKINAGQILLNKGSGFATQGEISFLSWNSKVQHILASTSYNGTTVVWDLRKQKPVISFSDSNRMQCSVLQWHLDVATQLIVASNDDSSPALSFSKYQKPIENYYIVWRF
ncbi:unnamed protein product [Camellia sinensis]